jgi:hypothetical protein
MGVPLGRVWCARLSGGTNAGSIGQSAEIPQRRIRNLRGFADVMRLTSTDAG